MYILNLYVAHMMPYCEGDRQQLLDSVVILPLAPWSDPALRGDGRKPCMVFCAEDAALFPQGAKAGDKIRSTRKM